MPSHRLFASIAWVVLGLSAAAQTANAAVKLPACSQSMITGTTWQAIFAHPQGLVYFACPINISSNGTLTPGSCTFPSGMSAPQPLSGTLTIDRACHVTGTINYTFCQSVQILVLLWRSSEGSRLSGFSQLTYLPCCNYVVWPFEMIAE
jgi:hypothetical protein